VAAGERHSLLRTRSGRLWAWGHGSSGQLGMSGVIESATPLNVAALEGVVVRAVATSEQHTLAVDAAGELWQWGLPLGVLAPKAALLPQRVAGLGGTAVRCVAVGATHALALTVEGALLVWGLDTARTGKLGQAGPGRLERQCVTTPEPMALHGVTAIAAGVSHSLAATEGGGVLWGWGAPTSLGFATGLEAAADAAALAGAEPESPRELFRSAGHVP